jgi:large subunit ribosomal protein L10
VDKNKKIDVITMLKEVFANTSMVLVIKNKGITVAKANDLRRKVKKADCSYLVTKNSLAKIAVQGSRFEQLVSMLAGPTALAYSNDPVAIAKIISEYAKDNEKFEILGGMFNEKLMSTKEIEHLATLPSLDELRAKIVGILCAPATQIATVLQAPAADLARIFDAYSKK